MKKTFLFLLTLIGILLVSCNSIDSQISKYEKACEEGDYAKATKIAAEIGKHPKKLTPERTMRITNANMKLAEKITGDSFESAKEYQEEAFKAAKEYQEDAYESAQKAQEEAYESAKKAQEEAYKSAKKSWSDLDDDDDDDF